jgi:predicted dehydrogenase
MQPMIRVALIGTGQITLANHLPGVGRCREAAVTALCDTNPQALEAASRACGLTDTWTDPDALLREADVDAVIIATPNRSHHALALAAIAARKHVLCEKPLAMTLAEAIEMAAAAEAAGVRHMTAFTYRFVPAMRYARHLVAQGYVGQPWHFRAQRFMDWGRQALGWRQQAALAGTGQVGDMLSHRIDFGHVLVGTIVEVLARTTRVWDTRVDAEGREQPSDLEDWAACLVGFANGATGVLESSKVATAYAESGGTRDRCEVNGPDGSLIYDLSDPGRITGGRRGGRLETIDVPAEYLTWDGTAPDAGVDPQLLFRWDQDAEFIAAIRDHRPAEPSFHDGVRVQAVIEAIMESAASSRAVPVAPYNPGS